MTGAALRSLLFVPGDSERKLAKAVSTAADAIILDLEDSVAHERLPFARGLVADFLQSHTGKPQRWVRVNALESGQLLADLVAIVRCVPDGIVLPKVSCQDEVKRVHHYLSALEAREGIEPNSIGIIVIAGETATAVLQGFADPPIEPRVRGITWGVEDLASALGARSKYEADGSLTFTFQLARSQCLLAAAAASASAIDGVYAKLGDTAGLEREARAAFRDGFHGKLAIHPDQVPVINAAFTPTPEEIDRARAIVRAFETSQGAGVVNLNGRMLDRPHLALAQRTLAAASASGAAAGEDSK
ncbi:MAG TPA: CoA ester lyase [Steroidobacteraceae bacterium]